MIQPGVGVRKLHIELKGICQFVELDCISHFVIFLSTQKFYQVTHDISHIYPEKPQYTPQALFSQALGSTSN